jgi:S1-C subfamily serine protease
VKLGIGDLHQICNTSSVVGARAWRRDGLLVLVFGFGLLAGQGLRGSSEAKWLPVAGLAPAEAERESPVPPDPRASDEQLGGSASQTTALAAAPPANSAGAAPPPWSEVATQAQHSTVGILAGDRYGAGILIDPSGLVLTNLHVVQGLDRISVLLFGGQSVPALVLDQATDLDLALLQLKLGADGALSQQELPAPAQLGSVHGLQVGDDVLAVGSPRKMYFSVSRGMVSYLDRKLDKISYIQSDLPINAGNSGGPLVDRAGRVIGVVSFILRDSQGIAFALPIDYARERFSNRLEHSALLQTSGAQPCGASPCPVGASG